MEWSVNVGLLRTYKAFMYIKEMCAHCLALHDITLMGYSTVHIRYELYIKVE
jgi:hypothetical protein